MMLSLLHIISDFKRNPGYSFKMFIYYAFSRLTTLPRVSLALLGFFSFLFFFNLPSFFVLSLSLFFLAFLYIMLMTSKLTHKLKPDLQNAIKKKTPWEGR